MTKLMLEAGAKVYHENSVGRNAAQMAAFVGKKFPTQLKIVEPVPVLKNRNNDFI